MKVQAGAVILSQHQTHFVELDVAKNASGSDLVDSFKKWIVAENKARAAEGGDIKPLTKKDITAQWYAMMTYMRNFLEDALLYA